MTEGREESCRGLIKGEKNENAADQRGRKIGKGLLLEGRKRKEKKRKKVSKDGKNERCTKKKKTGKGLL